MPSLQSQADILIITVTRVESSAVISVFREATGQAPKPQPIGGRIYHNLGAVNDTRVFMALSEMGAGGMGASQQAVQKGIAALRPAAVIMVGIAFGIDEQKQAIGDILVSQQLSLYDLQRIGKDIVLRGDKPHASTRLIDYFRNTDLHWNGAKVRFGLILTGEKLVDNVDYRDQLKQFEPEAIGGEMEGAGLYVACQDAHVDWILVKAICDWADGNKAQDKDERQQLAAENAAQFVLQALKLAPFITTRRRREPTRRKIKVEPFPRPGEGYASLKIYNGGHQGLRCYAYLSKLFCVDNPNTSLDIKDSVNPGQARLTWHGGSPDGKRDINSRTSEILNIACQNGDNIEFTLQDGNHRAYGQCFEVEVEIRAEKNEIHVPSLIMWKGLISLSPVINIQENLGSSQADPNSASNIREEMRAKADRTLFGAFLKMLPSDRGAIGFLRNRFIGHSYTADFVNDLDDFTHNWDTAERTFHATEIESLKMRLISLMNEILEYGAKRMSPINGEVFSILYEYDDPRFRETEERITQLAGEIVRTHQELIQTAKILLDI